MLIYNTKNVFSYSCYCPQECGEGWMSVKKSAPSQARRALDIAARYVRTNRVSGLGAGRGLGSSKGQPFFGRFTSLKHLIH
jgi:hypothetical protein